MKTILSFVCACAMVVGLVGCGKTLTELRADSDAIVDTTTGTATQTIGVVGTVVKKLIAVGFAAYDLVKKAGEDTKDNINVVKGVITK